MGFFSQIIDGCFSSLRSSLSPGGNATEKTTSKKGSTMSTSPETLKVATPTPDHVVPLTKEESLLSRDFEERRAITEAKFRVFQEGIHKAEKPAK